MSPVSNAQPADMILQSEAQDTVDAINLLHQEVTHKLIRALAQISAKERIIASLQAQLVEKDKCIIEFEKNSA